MARILLFLAAAAAFLCLCAVRELGTGEVEWDCQYYSAAECAPTVVAGNRGFCNLNPYLAQRPLRPPRAYWHHRRWHYVPRP